MRISIVSTVSLNVGDAAILYGLVAQLERAFGSNAEIVIHDREPDVASRYYDGLRFVPNISRHLEAIRRGGRSGRLLRLALQGRMLAAAIAHRRPRTRPLARLLLTRAELADLEVLARSDLVVAAGGTYLVERYSLDARNFEYRVIRAVGRPLMFWTQSLGPFEQPSNRRRMGATFKSARLLLVRDDRSRRALLDLGVDQSAIRVTADAAFALTPKTAAVTRSRPGHLNAAISVRDWQFMSDGDAGRRRYEHAIAALTATIVRRHGGHVTFLSTCQGIPEYWTDDSRLATDIVSELPPDVAAHVTVDGAFHSPAELQRRFAEQDFVVATRMHAAILALTAGVPVLPIAYEFKTQELFGRLGMSRWVLDVESVDADSAAARVSEFVAELPVIGEALTDAVAAERLRTDEDVEVVRAAFDALALTR